MKKKLRRSGTAWAFLLSLLFALPLACPADAQENSSTRAYPSVSGAARKARYAAGSIPRAPRPWAPPDLDHGVPPVAPDVVCALPEVLQGASQRVKELVTNLQQFTATEWLEHEQVDGSGNAGRKETRTFTYLAAIEHMRPGMLSVDEYRNGATALEAFPAGLATTGLAALALIFHPYYLD